jgi:hypothetical protein
MMPFRLTPPARTISRLTMNRAWNSTVSTAKKLQRQGEAGGGRGRTAHGRRATQPAQT